MGQPNSVVGQIDFWDNRYEGRRLFSELLGTFLPRPGCGWIDHSRPLISRLRPPGRASRCPRDDGGRHHPVHGRRVRGASQSRGNSVLCAERGLFLEASPRLHRCRIPGGQPGRFALWGLLGRFGTAGMTLPGHDVANLTALLTEVVLTAGLVSVILGTPSGAQQSDPWRRFLYRARRDVGSARKRCIHESGTIARTGTGVWQLDFVVGVCGGSYCWGRYRRRHRVCVAGPRGWQVWNTSRTGYAGLEVEARDNRNRRCCSRLSRSGSLIVSV